MKYNKPLPSVRKLKKLAEWDGPFPMKSYRVIIGASRYGFDDDTISFLELFRHDTVFQSRDDFLNACEKLADRIRAAQNQERVTALTAPLSDTEYKFKRKVTDWGVL